MYELKPIYDSRKSFYKKAHVLVDGSRKTLRSYETNVAEINNEKAKIFGFYSNTTIRHIKEFLKQNGFRADTKKQMEEYYT